MRRFQWALAAAAMVCQAVVAKDFVIHAGTLIDGVSETPRRQVSIVVHDGRIASVEPGYQRPRGAEVIDLSTQTVLPGDPLRDPAQFEHVSFVMKGGVVYRDHGTATAALSD